MSIQDLKAKLSTAVAQAETGRTNVITRHNEPVARLGQVKIDQTHRDRRSGTGGVQPAIADGTKGRYLAVLLEDSGAP